MKYAMIGLLSVLMLGCKEVQADPNVVDALGGSVTTIYDPKRGVTCYVYKNYKAGGIFCFTDKQLKGE